MTNKELQLMTVLRKDRVANRIEKRKVRNAMANPRIEHTIFRIECVGFVQAYGSIERTRKESVLN